MAFGFTRSLELTQKENEDKHKNSQMIRFKNCFHYFSSAGTWNKKSSIVLAYSPAPPPVFKTTGL